MADMLAEDAASIVRSNLLTQDGYTPYCGGGESEARTVCRMPRTVWDGEQFKCPLCRWRSAFPADFIARYRAAWPRQNDKG